jgi:hypothetical protein
MKLHLARKEHGAKKRVNPISINVNVNLQTTSMHQHYRNEIGPHAHAQHDFCGKLIINSICISHISKLRFYAGISVVVLFGNVTRICNFVIGRNDLVKICELDNFAN